MSTVNQGTAKAWVNLNGRNILYESHNNVSSVTDNGTGDIKQLNMQAMQIML